MMIFQVKRVCCFADHKLSSKLYSAQLKFSSQRRGLPQASPFLMPPIPCPGSKWTHAALMRRCFLKCASCTICKEFAGMPFKCNILGITWVLLARHHSKWDPRGCIYGQLRRHIECAFMFEKTLCGPSTEWMERKMMIMEAYWDRPADKGAWMTFPRRQKKAFPSVVWKWG